MNQKIMKKALIFLFIIMVSFLLYSSFLLSNQDDGFMIKVDPRVELLAVIQSLTRWPDIGAFTRLSFDYYNEVKEYFKPYKEHPAVEWFDKYVLKGWSYDAPPQAMLHLSDPPDMKVVIPFTEYLKGRGQGEENLNEMVELMNRFIEDSNFMKFWKDHQPFYKEFIDRIENQIPFEKYSQLMMDFYGEKKGTFIFLSVPLFHGGGYGGQLETDKGNIAHYFGGPHKVEDGFPVYRTNSLRTLVFHEFGHSFVNPVVYDHSEELNKFEGFYEYMKSAMQSMAYGEWLTVCHEHLVRTGEAFLLKAAGFLEESTENFKTNLDRGFKLLPFFKEKMDIYEEKRDKYPTFRSYFPELLKVFEEVEPVTYEKAGAMNFTMDINAERCIVKGMGKSSPFIKAGVKDGDILYKLNNIRFDGNTYFEVMEMWDNFQIGGKYKIIVMRDDKEIELEVIVPAGSDIKFVKKK